MHVIRITPWNTEMPEDILTKLQDHFSRYPLRTYAKGEFLLTADENPEGVLFLEEGSVEQHDFTPEGNKVTVNVFKPPAFFPMSWAINHTPNNYFFAALTPVSARLADPKETVAFLHNNPDVLLDLLARVYRGTDGMLRRMVLASHGAATTRLIFELLIDGYRFGERLDNGTILIKTKQNALAERSGLARETVNRELHKLQDKQLVELTEAGILFDPQQLEQALDSFV